MIYADYAYYSTVYGGTLTETEYNRLARQASAYLDCITRGRICAALPGAVMGKVKDACCAVADAYALNTRGGGIASETNDGISVTYVAGVSTAKTDDQRLYGAAALYLAMTGLLYMGAL